MITSILQDKKARESLKNHIHNKDSAKQIYVWDAFKAYIRVVVIQQDATLRDLKRKKTNWYENKTKRLEKEFWTSPTESRLSDLVKAKKKNLIKYSLRKQSTLFLRLKQKWYEG